MPNTYITREVLMAEAAMELRHRSVFYMLTRGTPVEGTLRTNRTTGGSIVMRIPAVGKARRFGSGPATPSDHREKDVTLTFTGNDHLYDQKEVTAHEATFSVGPSFLRGTVMPIMRSMGHMATVAMYEPVREVYNFVGNPADPQTPSSLAEVQEINKLLTQNLAPKEGRFALLDPEGWAKIHTIEAFTTADKTADGGDVIREGARSGIRRLGLTWYEETAITSLAPDGVEVAAGVHVAGTFEAGAPLVNGAVVEGATTMNVDGGAGAETFLRGDLFLVDGVTKANGDQMQFVCLADSTATGGAITGLPFSPAAPVGGFANDAPITIVKSHRKYLAAAPGGIISAMIPVSTPDPSLWGSENELSYMDEDGHAVTLTMHAKDSSDLSYKLTAEVYAKAKLILPEMCVVILGTP